jgi:hypothetical protein
MSTQVEILVNGKPVKQYRHNGNTYVEARDNTEYTVKVKNDSYKRRLVVITVDGINVISGKPQDESIGSGYVINSRSSLDIKGFRKDNDTVGAFKFCKKSKAYCNEAGLPGNNGVIGVRVYDEKNRIFEILNEALKKSNPPYILPSTPVWPNKPPHYPGPMYKGTGDASEYPYTTTTEPFPGTMQCSSVDNCTFDLPNKPLKGSVTYSSSSPLRSVKSAPDFSMGSTWGTKINDSVRNVEMEVEETFEEFVIYYDTKSNLEDLGIVFKQEKEVVFPKAFGGFAKPPSGWKG